MIISSLSREITLGPSRFAKHSHLPNSEVVSLQKVPQWVGGHQGEIIDLKSSSLHFHCLGSSPNCSGGRDYTPAWHLPLSLPMRLLCWVKLLASIKTNLQNTFLGLQLAGFATPPAPGQKQIFVPILPISFPATLMGCRRLVPPLSGSLLATRLRTVTPAMRCKLPIKKEN